LYYKIFMQNKKIELIIILFLLTVFCVVSFLIIKSERESVIGPQIATVIDKDFKNVNFEEKGKTDEVFKLGFVGDIMLDRSVKTSVLKNGGDYNFVFQKIASTLKTFDWLFGNLEGPVSDNRKKVCGSIYSFEIATSVPQILKQNNFTVVSIANNHMFDYCYSGFEDTLKNLKAADLAYVGGGLDGDEAYYPKVFTVGNLKISVVAFSEFNEKSMGAAGDRGGVAIISPERVCTTVSRAKEMADLVVASFHFGEEYKAEPNSYQRRIAEKSIDCGADLVVGHHPHVIQPLEYYKEKPIVYSLGNFVFDQAFSEETMKGNILAVTVKDKKVASVELIPYKLNSTFQPEVLDSKR
jgi:poly-gamma-glutamate capsule biosynthesis protein CapA/YwtB (metallophosphatase superfamily)